MLLSFGHCQGFRSEQACWCHIIHVLVTLPFLSFWDPPVRHHPSTALHVFAPACALRRRPRLHISPSSRLRTMPFLDRGLKNYPPESVSSPPARCAALPGESSLWWHMCSTSFYNQKGVVTTLIAHHGTIRLCTVCCKHALICCGMS